MQPKSWRASSRHWKKNPLRNAADDKRPVWVALHISMLGQSSVIHWNQPNRFPDYNEKPVRVSDTGLARETCWSHLLSAPRRDGTPGEREGVKGESKGGGTLLATCAPLWGSRDSRFKGGAREGVKGRLLRKTTCQFAVVFVCLRNRRGGTD